MHASYRKQLARFVCQNGDRVTLNKSVVDHKSSYYLCVNGTQVSAFHSKDAAKTKFDSLCRETPSIHVTRLCDFERKALEIDSNRTTRITEVNFPTLAALNLLVQKRNGRCPTHIAVNGRVASIVGSQSIPKGKREFENWLGRSLEKIVAVAETQSYGTLLLRFFSQIFSNMADLYPFAFSEYLEILPQVRAAIRRIGMEKVRTLEKVQHFEPLDLNALNGLFNSTNDMREASLLAIYLSLGLRTGEGEKLRRQHLLHDGTLFLDEIQTKTANRKKKRLPNPPAPLVVKLALSIFHNDGYLDHFPEHWPTKHFRSTAATCLSLAGMPSLSVSARLGHTSRKMTDEFYVKPEFTRICVGNCNSIGDVLFGRSENESVEFTVTGKTREMLGENVWDWWVLYKLTEASGRFEHTTALREQLRGLLNSGVEKKKTLIAI